MRGGINAFVEKDYQEMRVYCTLKRIRNIYSQNPNSATSLPNTKFIFPKQIFIIPCGPSLPMRPKARVLALISVMPKLISAVY